jgi:parvulin-like peptidyl-prolyl isomerase
MAVMMADQLGQTVQVPEAALHEYYDAHKSDYELVHAKHILIRVQGSKVPVRPGQKDLTDAEALAKAQDILKRLRGGADFATVANQESDDGAPANTSGGDLPVFHHGQMVPSFEAAAFAMKPGELSEPVKSEFGYHIILLVSHETKSFDAVKPDLEKQLKPQETQKAVTKAIDDLEKSNPAVLDPVFFGTDKAPDKSPFVDKK